MRKFLAWLRTTFVSGLLAILPVGATIYILWALYQMLDGMLGREASLGDVVERIFGRWIPGIGILTMLVIILLFGVVMRNVIGRTVHRLFERVFFAVPGVRKMYGTLKQFSSALLSREGSSSFQKVVMFEYPKPGINVLGLVTNENLGKLQDLTGEECLLVYAPTAPNPLSGYMLIIPKRLVTYVDMPVEDALSMVVSSGSALPDSLRTDVQLAEMKQSRFGSLHKRQ